MNHNHDQRYASSSPDYSRNAGYRDDGNADNFGSRSNERGSEGSSSRFGSSDYSGSREASGYQGGRDDYGQGRGGSNTRYGQQDRGSWESSPWDESRGSDQDRDYSGKRGMSSTGSRESWQESDFPYASSQGQNARGLYSRGQGGGYSGYGNRHGGGMSGGYGNRYGGGTSGGYGNRHDASGRYGGGHAGKGPSGYTRSDERICDELYDRLTNDPDIDASSIEISVQDGTVSLSGQVSERQMKHHAEDCADQISGVKDVDNRIRVKRDDNGESDQGGTSLLS